MTSRPRTDRWFKLIELAAMLSPHQPRLSKLKRCSQRKYIWRLIRTLEKRDSERYMKRSGGFLYVSRRALESLLPVDERVLTSVEQNLTEVVQIQRVMRRQLNGHGARLSVLEQKQKLTSDYLRDIAAADGTALGRD